MSTIDLSPTTSLQQNPEILASALGNETVMMSMSRNKYYGLDDVGSRIWELLAQPQTPSELCAALQLEFAVESETCQREVSQFLQQLLNEGMLVTV